MQNEEEKIKKIIMDYYHEGHVSSNGELYRQLLHNEWKIFWLDPAGNLQTADKETYITWYEPDKADTTLKWETEFYYIDVTGDLASVKLKIANQQFGYIDYFNMMRIHGKWLVVHKISQRTEIDEKNGCLQRLIIK